MNKQTNNQMNKQTNNQMNKQTTVSLSKDVFTKEITFVTNEHVKEYIDTYIYTVNSPYLELSGDQQICSTHREFDLSSSHLV